MSDEPEFLGGPALRPDGTVEGRPAPAPAPDPARPAARPPSPEAPLELARRPPPRAWSPPTAYRPEPGRPRRWVPIALAGFVVAGFAIAAAAVLLTPGRPTRVPELPLPPVMKEVLPVLAGPPVVIVSDPPGATIRAADQILGVTPWAGNNPYLTDTELTLSLEGHHPKKLVLPGSKEAHLSVSLAPRRPR
ncbi:MAG: hypothetical protein JNJ54_36935 [Myxococcaceae bacterium]|nr:hypothetical protein [Myxococcaceae bacterium]